MRKFKWVISFSNFLDNFQRRNIQYLLVYYECWEVSKTSKVEGKPRIYFSIKDFALCHFYIIYYKAIVVDVGNHKML